jgi:hypothetical protein
MYVYAGTPDAVQQMQDEWLAVKQTGYEPISSRHCGQGHRRHLERSYPLRARRSSIPLPTSSIWSSSWQHEVPRSTSTEPCWKLMSQPIGCARQQAPGTSSAGEVALAAHSPSAAFHIVQARTVPQREYGLAALVPAGNLSARIFWAQVSRRLRPTELRRSRHRWIAWRGCAGCKWKCALPRVVKGSAPAA